MAKKKPKYYSYIEDKIRYMECSNCGSFVSHVADQTMAVLCSRCLSVRYVKMFPTKEQEIKEKKPLGWHWMKEFVDKDGNVFHKGKEMPELKGTLPPTKIKKTVRKRKKVKKKESYEQKIKVLAKEYKQKQKLKKEQHIGTNK